MKDTYSWTPANVLDFLEEVIPGHACISHFTYTSGFVLCSLSKEDLRRQAHDEQAANIIWAELETCRQGGKGQFTLREDGAWSVGQAEASTITIYICTHSAVVLELDVLTSDSVLKVKECIAAQGGLPIEQQRLMFGGVLLHDERSLADCQIHHGNKILMVRQLPWKAAASKQSFAPRGLLMVPGSKPWEAGLPVRPYIPILAADVTRNFPVSLEFVSVAERDAFAKATCAAPAALVIHQHGTAPARTLPLAETTLRLNDSGDNVMLEAGSDFLLPTSRYDAVVHLGGPGGELQVALVTGSEGSEVMGN